MTSSAWKSIERAVAVLLDGERTWDSRDDVDVVNDQAVIEVKHRRGITAPMLIRWLQHNEPKAQARGLMNILVIKPKLGPGRYSPFLAVIPLTPIKGTEGEPETNGS